MVSSSPDFTSLLQNQIVRCCDAIVLKKYSPGGDNRENTRDDSPLCIWTTGVIEQTANEVIAGGKVHTITRHFVLSAPAKTICEDTANGNKAVDDEFHKLVFTGKLLKC